MRGMTKKLTALALCLILCLGMLPGAAFAAEAEEDLLPAEAVLLAEDEEITDLAPEEEPPAPQPAEETPAEAPEEIPAEAPEEIPAEAPEEIPAEAELPAPEPEAMPGAETQSCTLTWPASAVTLEEGAVETDLGSLSCTNISADVAMIYITTSYTNLVNANGDAIPTALSIKDNKGSLTPMRQTGTSVSSNGNPIVYMPSQNTNKFPLSFILTVTAEDWAAAAYGTYTGTVTYKLTFTDTDGNKTVQTGTQTVTAVVAAPAYNLWVGGVQATELNKDDIPGVTGGKASFDPDTATLTLDSVTGVTGLYNNRAMIYAYDMDLTLNLVGSSTLVKTDFPSFPGWGILVSRSSGTSKLTVEGSGSLEINVEIGDHNVYAVGALTLVMNGGELTTRATNSSTECFALNTYNLVMNGGTLTAMSRYRAIGYVMRKGDLTFGAGYDPQILASYNMDGGGAQEITAEEMISSFYANWDDSSNKTYSYIKIAPRPVTAYDLWLGETQVTDLNKADILGDGTASYDPGSQTLTFTTSTPSIPGLHRETDSNGNVGYAPIWSKDSLVIRTPGSLKLTGPSSIAGSGEESRTSYLVYADGLLQVDGSAVLENKYPTGYGLYAGNGSLTVNGSVTSTTGYSALYAYQGGVKVTGGVDLTTTASGGNYPIYAYPGGIDIGGNAKVRTNCSYGLYAGTDITVDGDLDLENNYSSGYGLYAGNGSVTVNGSVTSTTGYSALYAYQGGVKVTGGVDLTTTASGGNYPIYAYPGGIDIGGDAKVRTNCSYGLYAGSGIAVGGSVDLVNNYSSGYGLYASGTITMTSGTWDIDTQREAICGVGGISIPDTHAITTPAGGVIALVEETYTVTEADGVTVAPHVVIEPVHTATATVTGVSLTLKGQIGIYVYAQVPAEAKTAKLTYPKTSEVKTFALDKNPSYYISASEQYKFLYENVPAKEMTQPLELEIFDADGNALLINHKKLGPQGTKFTCMAVDYCNTILSDPYSDPQLQDLVKAILNYGQCAQIQFKYDLEHLANPDGYLSDEMKTVQADPANDQEVPDGADESVGWAYGTLTLKGAVSANLYFTKAITAKDGKGNALTVTPKGGKWVITFDNIPAKNLGDKYVVAASYGGKTATIKYSALSYANAVLRNDSQPDTLKEMAKALILYNKYAKAYFGN